MNWHVSVLRCPTYDRELIFEKVHESLSFFGGIGSLVKANQKVLLKPNMLSAKGPENGITTHPLILEAMVREVQSAGAEVWIGDSPSGAIKTVKRCWENTGFLEVAEKTGARLVHFEAEGSIEKKGITRNYHIAKAVFEADVVINLPKFKTHGFALYTGAIKNLYGTLPGFQKATFHKMYPHPASFSEIIVDLYALIKPGFHLMDGILGMEGNGPSTGDLRQVGLMLASTNGIALDTIASHIMGFEEEEIDAIRIAAKRGLGPAKVSDIQVMGLELAEARIPDFNLPSNHLMKLVPTFLVRWVGKFLWVRPYADHERCTHCQLCAKGCPVGAIQMVDGYPVMDYSRCINCMCCNESCPSNAIVQKLSRLARLFG